MDLQVLKSVVYVVPWHHCSTWANDLGDEVPQLREELPFEVLEDDTFIEGFVVYWTLFPPFPCCPAETKDPESAKDATRNSFDLSVTC